MLLSNVVVAALIAGAAAYPDFLTNPRLRWVDDWKREAASRRAAREIAAREAVAEPECPMAALHKRDPVPDVVQAAATTATMTRGSQTGLTDPCFNVYQAPVPTDEPAAPGPDGQPNHGYQRPQTNDVRSPCPALNTLANHGYLPRNGRGIDGINLTDAFAQGWGIDNTVIDIPFISALSVCGFFSGGQENDEFPDSVNRKCDAFDLDVLNAPHQFEHDHSLSRNDYMVNFSNAPFNNHVFNGTIFNQSLAVLNNSCFMTIPQANEVRLQREVQQFLQDRVGWFTLAPATQETEIGFIFAVMSPANQAGGNRSPKGAQVRVNWWQYWFMYESFPTILGWAPPNPPVKNDFVGNISTSVMSASIYSTPSPYFTEFRFGPTGTFPSTSKTGTPSFNPTLPNLYTTNPHINKRAEITPAPALAQESPA